MKLLLSIGAITLGMFVSHAHAACPSDVDTAAMAARYANLQPAPNPPQDMTMADAVCGRDKFTNFLGQNYGKVVGYKAGLTNPDVQKRFNYPNPVRGTLFEKMLLKDGAEVPAKFGARPVFEADMVMEVKDTGINKAKTPLEALRHISRIYPFIELPDLVVEDPASITGPGIVYSNVGARLGVLGAPISVKATPELVETLANMTVKLVDQDGKELDTSKGNAILGQPLNAVLWLVKDVNDRGIALKKGDLLSLGSFSRLLPPKPGTGAKVTYESLPGNPSVSVRFRWGRAGELLVPYTPLPRERGYLTSRDGGGQTQAEPALAADVPQAAKNSGRRQRRCLSGFQVDLVMTNHLGYIANTI